MREGSCDRGTLSYWYDLSGNLTKRVDGDSIETDFAYDNANRRTAMTFPSDTAENTSFSYDSTAGGKLGVGRLTSVTEASGSTALTYDAQGRVIKDAKVISPGGYTTALNAQYAYDANGKIIQITYPSGDVAAFTRTTDGLITTVTFTPSGGSAQTIASGVAFEPYGPIQSFVYGNGLNLSRSYDQDYRLTNITVAPASGSALINLNFTWQTDGRIAASVDQVGNRTPSTTTATLLKTSLATGTNHITGATTLSGSTSRTLSYSTGGLLTQDIRAGLTTYGYGYNAARRLTSVTQGGSTAGAYAYDFEGQRVFRQTYGTGAAETAYVYDRAGHLLAEHNAVTGAVNREFIWIDDMPVALADISGGVTTVRFIHTGQIDEPLAVTSAARAIIWNGYVDPMGNGSTFSTPTLSPALDMRLPGQSFQPESGSLSQNHYRDYDPSLGRYIEADPLGIDAGQNVFAYVDGDPLNYGDEFGLLCDCKGISSAAMAIMNAPAKARSYSYAGTHYPGPNTNKCNIFVGDVLAQTGVEPRTHGWFGGPIPAGAWADPSRNIPHFPVVATPEPGDIAAVGHNYADASGHVAVVVSVSPSGVRTIGAGDAGGVHETGWPSDPTLAPQGQPTYRRCRC